MQRCSQGRWVKPCIQSKGLLDHFFVKPLRRHRVHDDVPAVPGDRGGGGDEGVLVQQGIAMALLALAGGAGPASWGWSGVCDVNGQPSATRLS